MTHDPAHSDRLARELLARVDLARIPGAYISDAKQALGPPTDVPAAADIDVPEIGRVRIWFRKIKGKRGSKDFWTMTHAELISPP